MNTELNKQPKQHSNQLIQHLAINTQGRDFVVGDVHGCFSQLKQALKMVSFDESVDRLICVGDLVDRGYENLMALSFLNQAWFFTVRGNHEQLHLDEEFDIASRNGMDWALPHHQHNGLKMNLDEYDQQYLSLVERFASLPLLMDIETLDGLVGVVHAEVPNHIRNWAVAVDHAQTRTHHQIKNSDLLWGRTRIRQKNMFGDQFDLWVKGVDAVICGHTPVSEPTWAGNHFNIDTGMVFGVTGRYDLHEDAALTMVNLTDNTVLRFEIVFGDVKGVIFHPWVIPD